MSTSDSSPSPATGENKSRVTKKLPTFRVGFAKQLDALRAYAVLSDGGTKSVHYSKVGELIDVHEANVSSMNPFFLENGFIEKQGAGYVPSAPVIEYNRAFSWNPETASQKLAPIIINSWFGIALSQRVQFRAMSEDESIEVLAAACMANPAAKPQLRQIIDYCEAAGVVSRMNGQIGVREPDLGDPTPVAPPLPPVERSAPPQPTHLTSPQDGGINLKFGIQVNLAEMKDWSPERITAFFGGIAQIIAAKNKDS